jgi:imidazolonepropionase-like amidohydrolase
MGEVYCGLRRAGVRLVASTDAGIPGVAHDGLARALEVFARIAGLSPLEALRSATSESAAALGLAEVTGRLRPGACSDLIVTAGDPLADLAMLTAPLRVIARGREVPLASSAAGPPMQGA